MAGLLSEAGGRSEAEFDNVEEVMQQNTTTERTDDKTDAPFRAGDVGSTRGHGTLRVRAVLRRHFQCWFLFALQVVQ